MCASIASFTSSLQPGGHVRLDKSRSHRIHRDIPAGHLPAPATSSARSIPPLKRRSSPAPDFPASPTTDAMLTIRPQRSFIIPGSTCCVARNAPVRLVAARGPNPLPSSASPARPGDPGVVDQNVHSLAVFAHANASLIDSCDVRSDSPPSPSPRKPESLPPLPRSSHLRRSDHNLVPTLHSASAVLFRSRGSRP